MNIFIEKKSFFLGVFIGISIVCIGIVTLAIILKSREPAPMISQYELLHTFKNPKSYEKKVVSSFKIYEVRAEYSLAKEVSDNNPNTYNGKLVSIIGREFYNDQIVTVKNPLWVGTLPEEDNYKLKIIPVIEGVIEYPSPTK